MFIMSVYGCVYVRVCKKPVKSEIIFTYTLANINRQTASGITICGALHDGHEAGRRALLKDPNSILLN